MKQANILIVDDDETITWTLATALKRRNDQLTIYQAHSGMEAFGCIQQLKSLDLLITDVHMPQLTGIELLKKLHERKIETSIIVITGFGNQDIYNQVEKLGAIRYFIKPFDLTALIDAAMQLIERRVEILKQPGFEGSFGRLNLVDVLQINGLIKKTGLLTIKTGSKEGRIYFQDGDIIHAHCANVSGEEAIYSIIAWSGGEFDFREDVMPAEKTISRTWEYILMEHCRRMDKNRSRDTKLGG